MDQENISFVLVRPLFLGNIGSVARVLKNFGFMNLTLVSPPRNYKDAEARKMSVGAFDVLKTSRVCETLGEAIENVDITVGTTCGTQRACTPIPLHELSPHIASNTGKKVAIIFGEERDGLTRQELESCQYSVCIPTSPQFASLNVAQAVGIIAYEISRAGQAPVADLEDLANASETEAYFTGLADLLHEVGFTRKFNQAKVMNEFRSLFQKAKPSVRELQLMQGALRKIEQKISSLNENVSDK